MKQIAVVLGAINLDNQRKLLNGMAHAAKEKDSNLFVFTNYVGSRETPESVAAANRILRLPDFSKFDGLILAGNTIHDPESVDRVLSAIRENGILAVSVDREYEGMSSVSIYSYDAEFQMTEHFIEHGYRDIYYVSGPLHMNREAQLRFEGYKDALEKNGIEFSQDKVYDGMFTLESGVEVGKRMLADGVIPEAIICGNDDLALGVKEVFEKAGYKIPDDIKLAGFDNNELSRMNKPTLTTVDKNQFEVGCRCVYELFDRMEGQPPKNHVVDCKLELRESCGCAKDEETIERLNAQMDELKVRYAIQQHATLRMSDLVRGMTTDFGTAHTVEDVYDILKEYIPSLNVNKFYLCTCEKEKVFVLPERNFGQNIDILKVNSDYTEKIEIPFAYEDGVFKSYPKFEKGFVLPEKCRTQSGGNVYAVNQIYYQNCCYGYAVCEHVDSVVSSGLYYSLLIEIGVGLEHIRKWMLLKDAVDKLNGMWCYDNMTKLYNRSGFYLEAQSILDRLREEDKWIYIIFIDADGLKTINDTMGHEAGDRMIQAIASVVHKNTGPQMLGMRYGGDEFVIFGGFGKREAIKLSQVGESIRRDISELNESGEYEFTISASLGASCWRAKEVESLSKIIEEADEKMYEEKRRKKKQNS